MVHVSTSSSNQQAARFSRSIEAMQPLFSNKQKSNIMTVVKQVINGVESLVITLPIVKRPSSSGKTLIVAGTGGFQSTNCIVDGKPVAVSVNATIK